MKAQCFLCKRIKNRKEVEMKEVRKGVLVYVCFNHYEEGRNNEQLIRRRDG